MSLACNNYVTAEQSSWTRLGFFQCLLTCVNKKKALYQPDLLCWCFILCKLNMLRSGARVLHSSSSETCVCGAAGIDMVFIVISFWQVHVMPTSCRENEGLWYIFSVFNGIKSFKICREIERLCSPRLETHKGM